MIDVEPGRFSTPDVAAWISDAPAAASERIVAAMAAALRVHPSQSAAIWSMPGCAVAMLAGAAIPDAELAPARSADGHTLWLAGEIFDWRSNASFQAPGRSLETRQQLLAALVREGPCALNAVDGEYLILLWSAAKRELSVFCDRFGAVPAYWSHARPGLAIATGVRGVLMAPDIEAAPDADALKEAVTFGGFRLGSRTNVRGVAMLSQAAHAVARHTGIDIARYWRWHQVPQQHAIGWDQAIDGLQDRWQDAMQRRLTGSRRPGLHLSGGLDSRAILAEGTRQNQPLQTMTFGVPESDEVAYAARAAARARAPWTLVPLYAPGDDWLSRRASFIQQTDGLIELGDLKHLETLELQTRLLDVHLSGYIGDFVVGPRFNDVDSIASACQSLPFYGGELGMGLSDASSLVSQHAKQLAPAALRFFLLEHKVHQSTNRWTAAFRRWVGVRKPFTAYAVFDFCQSLPPSSRAPRGLRERWVKRTYPELFDSIPDQSTGVPVMSGWARLQSARAARAGRRQLVAASRWLGLNGRPQYRDASPDHVFWLEPRIADRLIATITSRDALAPEIFGRARVERVVHAYFSGAGAPTQVIGALFSFEAYHRGLSSHLRDARAVVETNGLQMRQVSAG